MEDQNQGILSEDTKAKAQEYITLCENLIKEINKLQSPFSIPIPSFREIKINIIIRQCNVTRDEAIAFIDATPTELWDGFIQATIQRIKSQFPEVTMAINLIKQVIQLFTKNTASDGTSKAQAAAVPVTTSGGSGTANASALNNTIQSEIKSNSKGSGGQLKMQLLQVGKTMVSLLADMASLMLYDLLTPVKNLLNMVTEALRLYNSIPKLFKM